MFKEKHIIYKYKWNNANDANEPLAITLFPPEQKLNFISDKQFS